jgi:hypothetical protein
MMVTCLDDCLTSGSYYGIKEVIEELKKNDFGLKIEEYLKDYLSCHIKIDQEDGIAWIQQPYLINNLKAKFGEEAMAIQDHRTPGTPLFKICAPKL